MLCNCAFVPWLLRRRAIVATDTTCLFALFGKDATACSITGTAFGWHCKVLSTPPCLFDVRISTLANLEEEPPLLLGMRLVEDKRPLLADASFLTDEVWVRLTPDGLSSEVVFLLLEKLLVFRRAIEENRRWEQRQDMEKQNDKELDKTWPLTLFST